MATSFLDANRDPNGFQQITDLAASVGLTVPAGSDVAIIQVTDQAVRWRDDGVDPTPTVGMRLAAGSDFLYTGDLSEIEFIEEAAGAIVNVSYYE